MKDYRETLIRIDHDAKTCEVWTERRGVISRLKRSGFIKIREQNLGVWFSGTARQVLLRAIPGKRPSKTPTRLRFSTNGGAS